jgi:hypothetical protein
MACSTFTGEGISVGTVCYQLVPWASHRRRTSVLAADIAVDLDFESHQQMSYIFTLIMFLCCFVVRHKVDCRADQ